MSKIMYLVTTLFLLLLAVPMVWPVRSLAAPPERFQTQVVVSSLNSPTDLGLAPDGRLFILEKGGTVKIYKDGSLLAEPFVQISVNQEAERGLLGVAFDPDFDTNSFVYFYYTGSDLVNRVVRYDASSDVATSPPNTIYEVSLPAGTIHQGGTIAFGPDEKLYISVGNNGVQAYSQNLTNAYGKILRLNKDGSIPADNPFAGHPTNKGEIWAYGLRNPFRFHFDEATGRLYAGDVGDSAWEEINLVVRDGNYGYPETEGACDNCSFINPIYQYFHEGNQSFSVTGGPVYHGNMFPSEYQGSLFFADYARGFIKRLSLDNNGNQTGVYEFDPTAGTVVDMEVASDGSLYYVTIFPGTVYRVTYASDNQLPVAVATAEPRSGEAPLTVQFSSDGSQDPEGADLNFNWNFSDETSSTEPNPSKTYETNGTYTVTLTVGDGTHTSQATPLVIEVGAKPVVTISTPTDGAMYSAGDTISYQASAVTSSGEVIPESEIDTEVLLHHHTHIHPFLIREGNATGSFVVPDQDDHPDANTWYEIKVTAHDAGLSSSTSVMIYPKTSQLTFASEPSGLVLYLDSIPLTTPQTFAGVVGFQRELKPQLIQQKDGTWYHFDHWSQGGETIQDVTTPEVDTTYTAHFSPMSPFTAEYFSTRDLSGEPVLTRQDQEINFVWNQGSPDPALSADQFSVRWTKTQQFAEGAYRFTTSTDDGVRLFINDQPIIDDWQNQPVTENSQVVYLPAGQYDLRMEYFEDWGGAIAKLQWAPTTDPATIEIDDGSGEPEPSQDFVAEYFNNKNLEGSPVLTRHETEIDHQWHHDAPDPSVPGDQFSTRWTKTSEFEEGVYRFTVSADDGVRLYVDGVRVIDKWLDQKISTYSLEKYLSQGEHTVVMEYYENYGGAFATLKYEQLRHLDGFAAEYFGTQDLSGTPLLLRTDPQLNFVWNYDQPHAVVPGDHFSVRWVTEREFAEGTHHFLLRADDGIRFWIDDQLIVDDWTDHPMRTYEPRVPLTAGPHLLRVEFYENDGSAVAILEQLN